MIDELKSLICLNKFLLPSEVFYFPIAVARGLIHVTNYVFTKIVGQYLYSPEIYRQELKRSTYNFTILYNDYFRWRCRFLFRDFFVAPLGNYPMSYEIYQQAHQEKNVWIDSILRDIEKDIGVRPNPGGLNFLQVMEDIGCCKLLTEHLAYHILTNGSVNLTEVAKFAKGVSLELAAKQYACAWFHANHPSVDTEAFSRFVMQLKSSEISPACSALESQSVGPEAFDNQGIFKILIDFNPYGSHQLLLCVFPEYSLIVDPNIGLFLCDNTQQTALIEKIIDSYQHSGSPQTTVKSLELVENFSCRWQVAEEGFLQYCYEQSSS